MWKVIIQAMVAVVTVVYESYGLIQTATSGMPMESSVHRWDLVAVFFVFLGLVAWAIMDREHRIHTLEGNRPSIKVRPRLIDDDYYLEVENNGAPADFECQIRICQDNTGHKSGELYLGYWEFGAGGKTPIMNIDRVKIAHRQTVVYSPDSAPLFPFLMSLQLYFYDKASSQLHSWSSAS